LLHPVDEGSSSNVIIVDSLCTFKVETDVDSFVDNSELDSPGAGNEEKILFLIQIDRMMKIIKVTPTNPAEIAAITTGLLFSKLEVSFSWIPWVIGSSPP